jgi:hypothetical protein
MCMLCSVCMCVYGVCLQVYCVNCLLGCVWCCFCFCVRGVCLRVCCVRQRVEKKDSFLFMNVFTRNVNYKEMQKMVFQICHLTLM